MLAKDNIRDRDCMPRRREMHLCNLWTPSAGTKNLDRSARRSSDLRRESNPSSLGSNLHLSFWLLMIGRLQALSVGAWYCLLHPASKT